MILKTKEIQMAEAQYNTRSYFELLFYFLYARFQTETCLCREVTHCSSWMSSLFCAYFHFL